MRLIIEARLADEDCDVVEDDGVVVVIERRDRSLSQLGLTLAERRSLLAKVQSVLVAKQVTGLSSGQTHCRRCRAALSHKDSRSTVLRTIYGKVTVKSPRPTYFGSDPSAQVNQLRGLLYEFGATFRAGRLARLAEIRERMAELEDTLPRPIVLNLQDQLRRINAFEDDISQLEKRIGAWQKQEAACRAISEVPGIGRLTATALVATIGDRKITPA